MVMELPPVIPLFPLPNVVFFPKTYLPLHIFEPRYRQMVKDAVSGDRVIGMVLLKDGWEADYAGRPPIHPVGCAGWLVQVEPLEDGRFNIVLYGVARFVMSEEFNDRPYRRARIDLRPDPPDPPLDATVRQALASRALAYARRLKAEEPVAAFLNAPPDDETLVHTLAASLPFTVVEKQFLLEAETLVNRARRLADLLRLKLAEATTPQQSYPSHDPDPPAR